jgi:DNA mismatch endonuclease (patch repair protein)
VNNRAFWKEKMETNTARDRRVNRTLREDGWRVLRIWEHDLARRGEARLLTRLEKALVAGNRGGAAPA